MLKEQNGKYYNLSDVVMISDEKSNHKKGTIYKEQSEHSNVLVVARYDDDFRKNYEVYNSLIPQHLHFLSNEKFKEGDYVYHNSGYVSKVLGFNMDAVKLEDAQRWTKDCKKIISSTDSSLIIFQGAGINFPIPSPSDSFVQKFISEYNKGNIIKRVLVEYGNFRINNPDYPFKSNREFDDNYLIKINSNDNTITIIKDKTTYTQEEVDRLLDRQTCETTAQVLEKYKDYKSKNEIRDIFLDAAKQNLFEGGWKTDVSINIIEKFLDGKL